MSDAFSSREPGLNDPSRRDIEPPCELRFHEWVGGDLKMVKVELADDVMDAWRMAAKEMASDRCFRYGRITCTWKGVRQFAMEID